MRTLARPGDTADLLRRLGTVHADSPRRWGLMSAHQMVCHVGDAVGMALGQQPVTPASGAVQRTLVKWIALYAPLPWPGGRIRTSPEIDQAAGCGTRPADFAQDVERLRDLMERISAQPPGFAWPPHPIFGHMSHAAWLRWGYLHLDHHLRQFGA